MSLMDFVATSKEWIDEKGLLGTSALSIVN